MIYFYTHIPAVENIHGWCYVMEIEYSYSSVIFRNNPSCFLPLILAASATKWLDHLDLQWVNTLQSPLSPFYLPQLGLRVGLIHHKGSRYAFLRQLSGCHLQFIYITGGGYSCMCVRQFKITFKSGDRCVADCWVAAKLKSSLPASARTLPLTLSGHRLPGWRGGRELWVIYEPAWERWEGPVIPCQEGTLQGERLRTLKCHFLKFATSLLLLPQRPRWEVRLMKNGSHYIFDPSWSLLLTPTSYKCNLIAMS